MSGDIWVVGLNTSLAWWLLHRVRMANRARPGSGPTGSAAWWGPQSPAERDLRRRAAEDHLQE